MKYHMPTVGMTFPAKENDEFENPGPRASVEKQTQWLQAQAQQDAFNQNAHIAENWLADGGGWGRWLNEYESGRMFGPKGQGDPDAATPTPPRAKVVEVKEAEAGWIFFDVVDGEDAACDVPEYTKKTAPQHYVKRNAK